MNLLLVNRSVLNNYLIASFYGTVRKVNQRPITGNIWFRLLIEPQWSLSVGGFVLSL